LTKIHDGSKRYNNEHLISVLIDEKITNYKFDTKFPLYLLDDKGDKIALIKFARNIEIISDGNKLVLLTKGNEFTGSKFSLSPVNGRQYLSYKYKKYKGALEFYSDNGMISVVNKVDIEEYLKGVLPVEMLSKADNKYFEALKAFAITARTYAYCKIDTNNVIYNIKDDVSDQVYSGVNVENELCSSAVEETKGMILYYNNKPATVFYHSTCGGIIEDASNIFPKVDVPYLKMKADGDEIYCSTSPIFTWKEIYSANEIKKFIIDAKLADTVIHTLTNIYITKRFPSGRNQEMSLIFDNKTEIKLTSQIIRNVFRRKDNGGILRSLLFNVEKEGNDTIITKVIFDGKGYGHGVGLCQWGALNQSKAGKDYKEILDFYFPSTEIKRIDE
jgi:stage II sporulation protein D